MGAHPLGPGTVLRGRFLLKERLDHGRFGTIYKALDRQSVGWDGSPGHVAVLILPPEITASQRTLAAAREDVARLRSLMHPHIVGVFDFDADGDVHFLTMELADGESLRTVLDNLEPELLWQEEALEVVHAVGAALDFAHQRGIVHGDVRPENVIVCGARDVKLLFASTCLLRSGPFAPEPRDDVFGLGCLTYELLAGTPPFAGHGSAAVEPAREPRRIKGLPRRQWDALRATLAPRDSRTRSVARFMSDMRFAPPPPPREAKRRRRRAGRAFAVVAALLTLLAAGAYLNRDPLGRLLAPDALRGMLQAEPRARDAEEDVSAPVVAGTSLPPEGETRDGAAPAGAPPEPRAEGAQAPAEAVEADNRPAAASEAAELQPQTAPVEQPAAPPPLEQPSAQRGEELPVEAIEPPTAEAVEPLPVEAVESPPVEAVESPPVEAVEPPPVVEAVEPRPAEPTEQAAVAVDPPAPSAPSRARPRASTAASVFGFVAGDLAVSEGGSVVPVEIVRLAGSGPATVAWWTSDGTAVAGEDYANFGAVIESFAAGERRRTIRIPITADGVVEERESFYLSLRGGAEGEDAGVRAVTRMTITIVDDD